MATRSAVVDRELPTDLAEAFRRSGRLEERPETLGEGFDAVTSLLDEAGVTVTLEDMYQPVTTRHSVHVGDTVEHVPCVLDAMIVAVRLDTDPVRIDSEPPGGGETVRYHVTDDEVTVTPHEAVASFGLGLDESADPDVESLQESLNDPTSPIPTTCSVINSFPDPEAYEEWAATVTDAPVMQISVEELFELAQEPTQSTVVA